MTQTDTSVADSVAAAKSELAGELLRDLGPLRFPASGGSMLPTVWPGDALVVEPVNHDQVRRGDIVVIGRDGKLCGHRVVSIVADGEKPQWITQGDALPIPDRRVLKTELMGRVRYLIRDGKCIPVPAKLGGVKQVIAKILRRSAPAARVLVYLHRVVQAND